MGNALQDQLLKSGLVNDKQLKKAQKEKRKESQQGAGKSGAGAEDRQRARQQATEKVQRDRELNRLRTEVSEQKAAAAQVKQLVEAHRVPIGEGEVPYKFADEGKVKTLHVTESVRQQIAHGRLAIVRSDGRYELVPSAVAEKIQARSAAHLILWNQPPLPVTESADDEYAAYVVPDDLIW